MVVLTGIEGKYIKIYDPYLYIGKFNISSRRGLATVDGHTVYVSIDNFRAYSNYKKFFCFKNDRTDVKENTDTEVTVNYQVRVTANIGLNIRAGASTSYSKIGGYAKGSIVTISEESNGFGKTNKGWISLKYTSRINEEESIKDQTVGQIKKLARASTLYSNSNLTGYKYNYKSNTTITILQNVSENVDKIKVNVTGRIAYINVNCYR